MRQHKNIYYKNILTILFLLLNVTFQAQNNLSELLKQYNSNTVPYISIQELAMPKTKALIFDAREPQEYAVSHLKNAISVGYNTFNIEMIETGFTDKNQMIVVYCSVGIRSETIGEKLHKAGYKNIYNLYGGIFEWKNNGFQIFDSNGKETDNVHVFSKAWGKWLTKGIKIYD